MFNYFHKLLSPNRFLKVVNPLIPVGFFFSMIFIILGLCFGLFLSPPDYQQGETVRIMYVHVPSAWISIMAYSIIAFNSFIFLVWKFPLTIIIAIKCVPLGLIFTVITLVTGSIWGSPTWGTWWIWDARLTSFLVLLFLYLGLIVLGKAFINNSRGQKAFSILSVIGALNLPIIKFSVDWWNTLHQPASIMRLDGPSISSEILIPLLLMTFGFMSLFFTLLLVSIKTELSYIKLISLKRHIKRT